MNVDEFKAWFSRNVGTGGKRPKIDEFNKHLKGSERNPTAPEYPCKDVPEYNRYAAYRDLRKDDDDDQQQEEQSQQSKKDQSRNSKSSQSASRVAQNVARNVISKVVLVVVGGIVVVTTYNEIKAHEAAAVVTDMTWVWNNDGSAAKLGFWNKDGKLIKELPAVITSVETAATCTKTGQVVYTASVTDAEKTYTDTRTVELAALGHDFDEGTRTVIDGNDSIIYECNRCHEEFIITLSPGEIDPPATEYLANWTWSEDHLSCDVELADHDGHVVKQDHAEVTITETEATCTKEGVKSYKASYTEKEETYSTVYTEETPALGHVFDEGTETIIDGNPAIDYECTRCNEHFIIIVTPEEDFTSIYYHDALEEAAHLRDECHHHCHHSHTL